MREEGITDSTKIRVEPSPTPSVEIAKEYSDSGGYNYIAHMTYKDSTIAYKIQLSKQVLEHKVRIDTVGNYVRKIYNRGTISQNDR